MRDSATTATARRAATGARASPPPWAAGADGLAGIHVNMPLVALRRRRHDRPHRQETTALADVADHAESGMGYSSAAVHPAADPRVRAHRLPRRPVRVDPGEVLGVDRQRRPPRAARSPRTRCSTTSRSTGSPRPRRPRRASTGRASTRSTWNRSTCPSGVSVFPKEILGLSRRWAETALHRPPLVRGARPRRALRRVRTARVFVDEVRGFFRPVR